MLVLGSLALGMTLTSALLLTLEPGRVAPMTGVALTSIDDRVEPEETLFQVAQPRQWKAIYIHDSLTLSGSAAELSQLDRQMGRAGLGCHLVIDNGDGEADGLIEVGFRWQRQLAGDYLEGGGASATWFNENAIGVCLVGDADRRPFTKAQLRELSWLIRQLQARFHIPADRVYVRVGTSPDGLSANFPHAAFEQQLLPSP